MWRTTGSLTLHDGMWANTSNVVVNIFALMAFGVYVWYLGLGSFVNSLFSRTLLV